MIRSVLSLFERLIPRAASSLLLILLAWRTSPEVIGLYVWGVLAYTLVCAVTDSTMRQVVVKALKSNRGIDFVRSYQLKVAVLAPATLLIFMAVLWTVSDISLRYSVVGLVPLTIGPALMAWNILNIGRLQTLHMWRVLASGQLVASSAALAVGIPLVLALSNPFGAAVGTVLVEIVMAIWCRAAVRHVEVPLSTSSADTRALSHEYRSMAAYSGMAWGQGQTDRLFVGLVAGSHTLGVLSLGISLARALGDAVASSTANLLRAEVSVGEGAEHGRMAGSVLLRGMVLAAVAALITALTVKWVLDPLLPEAWAPAMQIVPILSLSVIPSVLSWSAAIYHVQFETGKRALIGPAVSILIALPVSMMAFWSLNALAYGIVAREFVLVLVAYLTIGAGAPWRSLVHAFGLVVVLGTTMLIVAMI